MSSVEKAGGAKREYRGLSGILGGGSVGGQLSAGVSRPVGSCRPPILVCRGWWL